MLYIMFFYRRHCCGFFLLLLLPVVVVVFTISQRSRYLQLRQLAEILLLHTQQR